MSLTFAPVISEERRRSIGVCPEDVVNGVTLCVVPAGGRLLLRWREVGDVLLVKLEPPDRFPATPCCLSLIRMLDERPFRGTGSFSVNEVLVGAGSFVHP
jgi:hypothetical protein